MMLSTGRLALSPTDGGVREPTEPLLMDSLMFCVAGWFWTVFMAD